MHICAKAQLGCHTSKAWQPIAFSEMLSQETTLTNLVSRVNLDEYRVGCFLLNQLRNAGHERWVGKAYASIV